MRDWKTIERDVNGWVNCDDSYFGIPSHTPSEKSMQCYCETKQYVPTLCADDGGDCLCNGNVFYMKKMGTPTTPDMFFTAFNTEPYTMNEANNTGSIKCGKSSFEEVNPVPGEDKQCWCDEKGVFTSAGQNWQIKEYWRAQLEAIRIREAKIALEQERREYELRIVEEQRLIQE